MNTVLRRIFGASTRPTKPAVGVPLGDIQLSLRASLDGCSGIRADRLLFKINSAKTPAELWALRSDLHQCIAQVHSECVAAQRINDLAQIFVGWVPAAQLANIHPEFKPSRGPVSNRR